MNAIISIINIFLDFNNIKTTSWTIAKKAMQRWDVPADAPPDLLDQRGRGLTTEEGYRISSIVLPRDFSWGYQSPAAAFAWMLLPWSIFFFFVFSAIPYFGPILAFVLVAATYFILYRAQAIGGLASSFNLRRAQFGSAIIIALLAAGFIYLRNRGLLGSFPVSQITSWGFLPPMWAWLLIFYTSAVPFLWARAEQRQRITNLQLQAAADQPSEVFPFIKDAAAARTAQATKAQKDQTPFFQLGTASGVCSDLLDLYAPDKDLPFGLTQEDLSTHMLVIGRTGTGKTSGILRPLAKQWLSATDGGLLIMDGKGELPAEFQQEDYTLIAPGRAKLALISGLLSEDVVDVISNLATGKEDQFWKTSGETLLRNAAVLLEFSPLRDENPQDFGWSIFNISRAINNLDYRSSLIEGYEAGLTSHDVEVAFVSAAITYFLSVFPTMPENTRGGIVQTVNSWMAPLLGHRELAEWARCTESDVDPADVLKGAKMGILCPAYLYGAAGPAISALVKARIYRAIRQRGSSWSANADQRQVLLLIDEAQEVLGRADTDMLPVARSLGLVVVAGTQSVEAVECRLGTAAATRAFLANFRSFASFMASPASMEWVSEQLGETFRADFSDISGFALTHTAAALNSVGYYAADQSQKEMSDLDYKGNMETDAMSLRREKDGDLLGIRYKIRMGALLAPAEIQHFLSEPFAAVCQVNRAGVARRDVVRTKPVFV